MSTLNLQASHVLGELFEKQIVDLVLEFVALLGAYLTGM